MKNIARELAQELRDADREGEPIDDPEGARFIKLSDRFSQELATQLDAFASYIERLEDIGYDRHTDRCQDCQSYWSRNNRENANENLRLKRELAERPQELPTR